MARNYNKRNGGAKGASEVINYSPAGWSLEILTFKEPGSKMSHFIFYLFIHAFCEMQICGFHNFQNFYCSRIFISILFLMGILLRTHLPMMKKKMCFWYFAQNIFPILINSDLVAWHVKLKRIKKSFIV